MKTDDTKRLENKLYNYLQINGLFCIFECKLGFGSNSTGIVDCISITSRNIITCYELKVTKSDFHSKHGHNFRGNYNYYVMPLFLYEEVKDEIPKHIGCIVEDDKDNFYLRVIKKSNALRLKNIDNIKSCIIRSLYREYQKLKEIENTDTLKTINYYKKRLKDLNKSNTQLSDDIIRLKNSITENLPRKQAKYILEKAKE